ncbi:hypothetical protein BKA66DRAFT_89128 [Pyrenochaeta sp. MPI-SDFR-AT-0127]|nr:hypothetical protein BKA66DRAFT_89128 [Pyrenochaeta sp. MPI-SDFR-AT-0127]
MSNDTESDPDSNLVLNDADTSVENLQSENLSADDPALPESENIEVDAIEPMPSEHEGAIAQETALTEDKQDSTSDMPEDIVSIDAPQSGASESKEAEVAVGAVAEVEPVVAGSSHTADDFSEGENESTITETSTGSTEADQSIASAEGDTDSATTTDEVRNLEQNEITDPTTILEPPPASDPVPDTIVDAPGVVAENGSDTQPAHIEPTQIEVNTDAPQDEAASDLPPEDHTEDTMDDQLPGTHEEPEASSDNIAEAEQEETASADVPQPAESPSHDGVQESPEPEDSIAAKQAAPGAETSAENKDSEDQTGPNKETSEGETTETVDREHGTIDENPTAESQPNGNVENSEQLGSASQEPEASETSHPEVVQLSDQPIEPTDEVPNNTSELALAPENVVTAQEPTPVQEEDPLSALEMDEVQPATPVAESLRETENDDVEVSPAEESKPDDQPSEASPENMESLANTEAENKTEPSGDVPSEAESPNLDTVQENIVNNAADVVEDVTVVENPTSEDTSVEPTEGLTSIDEAVVDEAQPATESTQNHDQPPKDPPADPLTEDLTPPEPEALSQSEPVAAEEASTEAETTQGAEPVVEAESSPSLDTVPEPAPPAEEESTPPAEEESTPPAEEESTPPAEEEPAPPAEEEPTPPAEDEPAPPAEEESTPPQRKSLHLQQRKSPHLQQRTSLHLQQRKSPHLQQRTSLRLQQRKSLHLQQRKSPHLQQRTSLHLQQRKSPHLQRRKSLHLQ